MTGWEYRVAQPDTASDFYASIRVADAKSKATGLAAWLNELGADGWELVGFADGFAVLKRPAPRGRTPRRGKTADEMPT